MTQKNISIIVPVYNEQALLLPLLERLDEAATALNASSVELIVVDDCSTDDTPKILREYTHNRVSFSHISMKEKGGKSKALLQGFTSAKGEIILMIDGDLQNDPADFPAMVALLEEGNDVVTGWRADRKDDALKCFVSKIYNGIINLISGMRLHDHNCGLKAIRASALQGLDFRSEWHRFLTVMVHDAGGKVVEMKVRHHVREAGKSRYGIDRYLRFAGDLIGFICRRF